MGRGGLVYWVLFGTALGVYLVMVLWSLPVISEQAGGLVPFDLHPFGYSGDEAREFLAALSPQGRQFYLGPQHWLDTFYPILLGIVIAVPFVLYTRKWPLVIRFTGLLALAVGVSADYLENAAVAQLLQMDQDKVTDAVVAVSSGWTMAKAAGTTVAFAFLLAAFAGLAVKRMTTR